jgi:hypothetical protein
MLIVLLGVCVLLGAALAVQGRLRQTYQFDSNSNSNTAAVPLLGMSIWDPADLAQDTSDYGHMPIVRVYYPGLPAANAWTTGLPAANHSAVIVSFKALPAAILSGADDAVLSHFFDTAPTGHPIYYSYYHEPEDNIANGEFTLADYKAAWAHVVALAGAAHNSDLHSILILMNWDLEKASGRDWKSYLPGGGIISTLGWDAYPAGSAKNINPQLTPPGQFMGPAIAAAKSVGLPYGFPEFSLSTPVGRTGWLTDVGNYLMNSGALFGVYYNGNPQYPSERLTSPADIAVWRSFIARSNGSAGPAPGPSPTPSPPPAAPASVAVTNLSLSASTLASTSGAHLVITFTLSQGADITVCVLDSSGSVRRTISRPGRSAGQVSIPYYGYDGGGHSLPAGSYQVLVVASNASGSGTAEVPLTITP